MASKIAAVFARTRAAGKPAFIPYVTAGFPTKDDTVGILLDLEAGGADIIEVGVPFSDPLADGGTIQRANEVALAGGVTVHDTLALIRAARTAGLRAPVILMGYYNPFMSYGEAALAKDCAEVGVEGFIVVDLPPEEAGSFRAECAKFDLCFVPLVAPTTTEKRLHEIARVASGYVYCVSITGITGARSELPADLADFLARVRAAMGETPVVVGFGLSTRAHVAQVGDLADGAVMGSAIIRCIETDGPKGVKAFVESVKL